eukprot:TRINITY_DN14078_c0_g1_i1.p1 TRINITY_DN14078_c0_g1~~TRINITY_DN14078_c0_g1_i1.p1  ORF type:complete len:127 (-),score=29.04 TRINITY_DN14078_c0_g1_i1:36-416(-)
MASESQKEAFVELQGRLMETNAKLKQVSQQLLGKEREKRRAVITGQELDELPSDTRTFRAIGKMFVLQSRDDLMEELNTVVGDADKETAKLQSRKEYLERQMKEIENNFRELLQQSPGMVQQVMSM